MESNVSNIVARLSFVDQLLQGTMWDNIKENNLDYNYVEVGVHDCTVNRKVSMICADGAKGLHKKLAKTWCFVGWWNFRVSYKVSIDVL